MAAGQRPINNVVDITNYVMLLTGQPLHAFDFDLVAGGRLDGAPRARRGDDRPRSTTSSARSTPSMLVIADADGPTSIAGIMGGERSEVRDAHHARADGGGELERPEHPAHLDAARRCAPRPPAASRRARARAGAWTGRSLATRLMLELTGARLVGGTIDVGGPAPTAATIRLRDARVAAAARRRDPARGAGRRSSSALGFGVGDGRRRARRHRARTSAATTSPARPTWSRRSRASGGWRSSRPRCRRAAAPAAGSSPRSGCAAGSRTRSSAPASTEAVGWSFAAPELVDRLRLAGDDPRAPRSCAAQPDVRGPVGRCARRCSARCSTPRARNRSRGMADVRLFEIGAVYLDAQRRRRRRRPRRRLDAARRAPAPRRAADRPRCGRRPGARPSRRARTSSPPRACSERCWARSACRWSVEPRARAVPAPRPRGARAGRRRARGLARRAAPGRRRALGPRAGRRLRARPRPCSRARADVAPRYEDLTSFPSVRQDLALVVPARRLGRADVLAVVRAGRRRAAAPTPRCSTSTAARRWRGPRLAGAAARVPRARPHADRRGGRPAAREDRRRAWPRRSGASCVAERRRPRRVRLRRRGRGARCCTATRSFELRT